MATVDTTIPVSVDVTAPVDQTSSASTPWYLDKALYVLVLGALVPVLNAKLGLNLSPEVVAGFLVAVVAYIAGHKWKSGTIRAAEISHQTQVAVATIQATTPKTPSGAADALGKL
jgi:hypothetical protein